MSKQTFRDPETGEEIESTALARGGTGLVFGLIAGLVPSLIVGLAIGAKAGLDIGLTYGLATALSAGLAGVLGRGPFRWFFILTFMYPFLKAGSLIFGQSLGQVGELVSPTIGGLAAGLFIVLIAPFCQRMHDGIAQRQHIHRQRILRQQEFSHVPDGALSRAQPPGEPEPTAASLSRADVPEEATPRLAAGVEAATEEEEQVVTQRQG
jgi:hypothetical protein